MAWRTARSLLTLRDEVNALAPNRSKRSDGTIGDTAHASRASRHNPNRHGVVTALDLTHDPAGGCDIHAIARQIARNPHPELAYIISDRQQASKSNGWRWVAYRGSNPHTIHAHFAVGVGPDSRPEPPYDSTAPWGIATVTEDAAMQELVTGLQEAITAAGYDPGPVDGLWGPRTQEALTAALSVRVAGSSTGPADSPELQFALAQAKSMMAAGASATSTAHLLDWYRRVRDAWAGLKPGPM